MENKKILIVPKITKVEWDMKRLNLDEKELFSFYEKQRLNSKKIFRSHREQKESLEKIKKLLTGVSIAHRDSLNKEVIKSYDLVIAFGGDNHFQYVSHFLDKTPLIGINSDPNRSEGALTSINSKEIEKFLPLILNKRLIFENWNRLKIEIDGEEIKEFAISEVFIGEEKRVNMSRHFVKLGNFSEEQKGSGILIATGAGSTGWYNSACRYLFPEGNAFSKSSVEARFLLTEPYNGRLCKYKLINGKIKGKEFLEIISLSDSSAYLSVDSLKLIKLREGAKIRISIGKPLKVVKLK